MKINDDGLSPMGGGADTIKVTPTCWEADPVALTVTVPVYWPAAKLDATD